MSKLKTTKHTRKILDKYNLKLNSLSNKFFHFLDKKPKPTNEEVRAEFLKTENAWKLYCLQNHLKASASLLFNARVSYEWECKYAKKEQK